MTAPAASGPRLGLAVNAAQFTLLVVVNALVGGVLGSERTVLTPLAEREFHLDGYTAALTYIVAFGITKAATNFFAGTLSDRYGRKPVLLAGWLDAIPVPAMLIWAPSWSWIVAANVLLGINQGLALSTTVIMKIDHAGPERRSPLVSMYVLHSVSQIYGAKGYDRECPRVSSHSRRWMSRRGSNAVAHQRVLCFRPHSTETRILLGTWCPARCSTYPRALPTLTVHIGRPAGNLSEPERSIGAPLHMRSHRVDSARSNRTPLGRSGVQSAASVGRQ